jgi:hypothetical protein
MRTICAALVATLLLTASAVAGDRDPDLVAPYRFNPAPKEMTTVDQQRVLEYRTQVQRQLKDLDRKEALGRLGPLGQRRLLDTRTEAGRMDQVTGTRPTGPAGFGSPLLPGMLPSLLH